MKKIIKTLALVVACTSLFSLTACGSNKTMIATSSNWYINANYQNIQPSSLTSAETATYSVKYKEGVNQTVALAYDEANCSLTTTLKAVEYDWNALPNSVESYKTTNEEVVYEYTTSLSLKGTYTFKADSTTVNFNDSSVSVAKFRSAGDNLAPVYSKQTIKCTAPASFNPSSSQEMVKEYDYVIETFYNEKCTQATVIYTDNLAPSKNSTTVIKNLDKTPYSLFDNASLFTVMRSVNATNTTAQSVNLLIPVEKCYSTYALTGSATQQLADDQTQIKNALIDAGYATEEDKVNYNAVTLSKVADMTGTNQIAWFSSVENKTDNLRRATMLKVIQGVYYGLGTVEYNLSSITVS